MRSGYTVSQRLSQIIRSDAFWNGAADASTIASVFTLLDDVTASRDWKLIPGVLELTSSGNDQIVNRVSAVLDNLLPRAPLAKLPGFEQLVRSQWTSPHAWTQNPIKLFRSRPWTTGALAMFTMQRAGFVREHAVRALIAAGTPSFMLPYLLLRLNDWVPQVRWPAEEAVRALLRPEHAKLWTSMLGLLGAMDSRRRVDLDWLYAGVRQIFLAESAEPQLLKALAGQDRHISRYAIGHAKTFDGPRLERALRQALMSADGLTRLRAARVVTGLPAGPDRDALLKIVEVDRAGPIRRLALYASLNAEASKRHATLFRFLLDERPSLRNAARVYLRDDPDLAGFDASAFYRNELAARTPLHRGAIAGLGETGHAADAELILPWISGPARIAEVAVRAVFALDGQARQPLLEELAGSGRPAVARAARHAFARLDRSVDQWREQSIHAKHPDLRSIAFRELCERLNAYETVIEALDAMLREDDALLVHPRRRLEFISTKRQYYPPAPPLTEAFLQRLAQLSDKLPADLQDALCRMFGCEPTAGQSKRPN